MADETVAQAFAAVPDPVLFESEVSLIAQAMLVGFQAGYAAATGIPLTLGDADPRRYELLYQADLISQSYAAGNWVSKQNLLKYAVGANLDNLGSFWGDLGLRLQPSQAECSLTFSLAAVSAVDVTVPSGTSASTVDGTLVYSTLEDCVIPAGSLFNSTLAQCTTPGKIGNGPSLNQVSVLQNWSQPYVVTVFNETVPSGGADLETDDHYRIRLYKLPKGLSTCGTKESYEFYALSANPSIAMVSVYSDAGISGTVIITPLMDGGVIPTDIELGQVQAATSGDNNRPLADQVIVAVPVPHAYRVQVSACLPLILSGQESALLSNGYAAISAYIANETNSLGGYIDPTPLATALSNIGFIDVDVSFPLFEVLLYNEQPTIVDDPEFDYGGLI
jgi:phage-related baseplate assembly protein